MPLPVSLGEKATVTGSRPTGRGYPRKGVPVHCYIFLFILLSIACTTEIIVVIDPTPTPEISTYEAMLVPATPAPISTFVPVTPTPISTEIVVVIEPTPTPEISTYVRSTPTPTSTPVPEYDMELVAQGMELEFNNAMPDIDWECQSKITTEPDTPVVIYCDGISYDDQVQFTSLTFPKEIGPNSAIVRGFEKTILGQAIVSECIIIEEQRCTKDRMSIPEAVVYLVELWQTYNDIR